MEEHFVGKIAQKAIVEKEGRVLITRDVRDGDVWELPGGRLNVGESLEEGLQREMQEELGVAVHVHKVVYAETFMHPRGNVPHVLLAYHATLTSPAEEFRPHDIEIAEMKWIDKNDLLHISIFPQYVRALETFFKTR